MKEKPSFFRLLRVKDRKGGIMPRKPRVIPLVGCLHIICRGNNQRRVFRYERDKNWYYRYLKKFKDEDKIDIHHYCFMKNHVHLIVGLNQESDLSRFMKRVNLKYFYYYRKKYTYSGHLWQGRFKSKVIDSEEYLIQCGKYIELNPVRAGVVSSPENYEFSSYHYYAFGKEDTLITQDPLYEGLDIKQKERQYAYQQLTAAG